MPYFSFPIPIFPLSPADIYLLYTGDDSYIKHLHWWISPIMMTIYAGMIFVCLSLRPKPNLETRADKHKRKALTAKISALLKKKES